MKFKGNYLMNYLVNAPVALAVERVLECNILSQKEFARPVLDIGCGDGFFAQMLFDEKIDTGVDPDPDEIERANRRSMYDELINCPGEKIPKEDSSYNTIFSNSTLEHIPDIRPVIEEAFRLLAPGGRFYVTVPTDKFDRYTIPYQTLSGIGLKSLSERYRKFFNRFWKHFHYYSKEDWKGIFSDAGFKVVEAKEYAPKAVCLFNDAMVPLALPSFFTKKLLNRWIISKGLRRLYAYPLYLFTSKVVGGHESENSQGGLVFFCLTKE